MKSRARDVLEEFASSYSEADVESLARLLEEIAKETARDILQYIKNSKFQINADIEVLSEKYGVELKE